MPKMSKIIPYINIHTHKKRENELSIESLGIHPYEAESGKKLSIDTIATDIDAIGEIGLDFSRPIDKEMQISLFREQLSIAEQLNLAVVIHAVRALDLALNILNEYSLHTVIIHGFIGSKELAQRAINQGYYLSFGERTFKSPKTLEALQHTPISNIFFETDDSEITIEEIYNQVLQYREESLEAIKEKLYTNYTNLFNRR